MVMQNAFTSKEMIPAVVQSSLTEFAIKEAEKIRALTWLEPVTSTPPLWYPTNWTLHLATHWEQRQIEIHWREFTFFIALSLPFFTFLFKTGMTSIFPSVRKGSGSDGVNFVVFMYLSSAFYSQEAKSFHVVEVIEVYLRIRQVKWQTTFTGATCSNPAPASI